MEALDELDQGPFGTFFGVDHTALCERLKLFMFDSHL